MRGVWHTREPWQEKINQAFSRNELWESVRTNLDFKNLQNTFSYIFNYFHIFHIFSSCSFLIIHWFFRFGSIFVGSRFGRMAGCSDLTHEPLECSISAVVVRSHRSRRSTTGVSSKNAVTNTSTQMRGAWNGSMWCSIQGGPLRVFVYFCQVDFHPEDLSIQSQLRLLCCLVQSCEGGAIPKMVKPIISSCKHGSSDANLVSISIVAQVPPNTTSPPPPEIEEDTGLGLPAIIALAEAQDWTQSTKKRWKKQTCTWSIAWRACELRRFPRWLVAQFSWVVPLAESTLGS